MRKRRPTLGLFSAAMLLLGTGCGLLMNYGDYGDQPQLGDAGSAGDASLDGLAGQGGFAGVGGKDSGGLGGTPGQGGGGGNGGSAPGGSAGTAGASAGGAYDSGTDQDTGTAGNSGSDGDAGEDGSDSGPCTLLSCGPEHVCVLGMCVKSLRVFATKDVTQVPQGIAAADSRCQAAADAAGVGGSWLAWLSTSSTNPANRFTQDDWLYSLVDGTLIATGWADLTDGALLHAIDMDEHGDTVVAAQTPVATGTSITGGVSTANCVNFTSFSIQDNISVGNLNLTGEGWTASPGGPIACDVTQIFHIYCFEQ